MIISDSINITISNNGKYYRNLNYGRCKQGDVIKVKIYHLPANSNKKVEFECDGCRDLFERQFQLLNRVEKHFCKSCSYLDRTSKIDYTLTARLSSERTGSKHPRWNPNKKSFAEYCRKVSLITRKKPIHLLENYEKPRGLCGIKGVFQLDHIISKKYGFDNNIDPSIIGDISNLQFIPWEKNRKKGINITKYHH